MITIINKLKQRIMIHLPGGKSINLPVGASGSVTKEEFASTHLQSLITKGYIAAVTVTPDQIAQTDSKPESKVPVKEKVLHPEPDGQAKTLTKQPKSNIKGGKK